MQAGTAMRIAALPLLAGLFVAMMAAPAGAATVRSGGLTYVTERFEPDPNVVKTFKARCPAGTHVWAGGHYNSGGFMEALPRHSYPYDSGDRGSAPDDGWKVQTSVVDGVVAFVYATCAEPKPTYVQGTLPVAPQVQGSQEIQCEQGLEAVSGGTRGSEHLVEARSSLNFGFGWFVSNDNYSLDVHTMRWFAVCVKRDRLERSDNDQVLPRTQEGHTVYCGPGTRIVGGGVGHIGQAQDIAIAASSPQGFASPGADGWQVYLDNFDNSTTYAFSVFATCVKPLN